MRSIDVIGSINAGIFSVYYNNTMITSTPNLNIEHNGLAKK